LVELKLVEEPRDERFTKEEADLDRFPKLLIDDEEEFADEFLVDCKGALLL
jgi:hypothetical protein